MLRCKLVESVDKASTLFFFLLFKKMKELLMQDETTGHIYVSIEVIERVAKLIRDQQRFFVTRDKKLLQSCKDRERGFLNWYDETLARIAGNIVQDAKQ